MKPRLIAILVANLFAASPFAMAQDAGMVWSGSVGIGVLGVNDKANDPSKLKEYRDLDSGVLGTFDIKGRGDNYYLNAFGENLGRDDQYINLWGGQYGVFKYRLYDNELRHNFGSGPGAISPFAGIGGSTLTATFPSLNTAAWQSFENSYKRRDLGGMFEFSGNTPWYIRADANEVRRSGIKNISAAQGTSPGNGFIELPSPVDFTTRNISLEGGYSSKIGHFALSALHSRFSNDNDLLRWSNGFLGQGVSPSGLDTSVLPPDNELSRLALNGNLRGLPLGSTLAGRLTYSKVTNNVGMPPTMLTTTTAPALFNVNAATNPSSGSFNGEIKTKTASLSLTSNPTREIDTRLYWNWAKKENRSTDVIFSPAQNSGLLAGGGTTTSNCTNGSSTPPVVAARPCEPELFGYKKDNAGIEGGYRFLQGHKISLGFDWLDTERERIDFTKTKDQRYYAEYRNSMLDAVTGRLKYQHLKRRSDFAASDPTNPIDNFVRRFDYANVDQDLVKFVIDASPVELLDLGFEWIYKDNDYKDTTLGRTADKRNEYYLSVAYGDPKEFRVMAFGDMEILTLDSRHRVGAGNPDPSAPPSPLPPANATTYNWAAKNKDRSWQVGVGVDWLPTERLKIAGSATYYKTKGTVDFTALASGGITPVVPFQTLLPIGNFDNTQRTAFNLKGTYAYDRHWDLTAGYAYERYKYSDIGYDGFTYTVANAVPASAPQTSYLTGQSAFQNYTVNIFYLMATYKF